MAKLPTRDSLGAMPSVRSGRAMAQIKTTVPEGATESQSRAASALARGATGLGAGIASIGNAAEAIEEHRRRQEAYNTEFRFQQFQFDQTQGLEQRAREIKPGEAGGFAEQVNGDFQKSAGEFLKTVPEHARADYEAKLFDTERRLFSGAAVIGRNEQKRFATNSINDATENIYTPRARTTSTEELNTVSGDYDRLVDANPDLTPVEKDEAKRKGRRSIGLAHLDGLPADRAQAIVNERGGANAEGLLRKFEGFREGAYWDVNAYRAGYGSDTVTRADGTVEKVTKDTKVTREDAERDLMRRSREFAGVVERQIGPERYASLPENVRAPLTSVAYNYGKLPGSVVQAAQSGDANAIAGAVAALPANPDRRRQEADVIRGGTSVFASLTDKDWESASKQAEIRLNAQRVDAERQAAAQQRERKRISDEAEDQWFGKIVGNDPVATATEIAKDGRLEVAAKNRMRELIEKVGRQDKTVATYGSEFYNLFQRIHAPEGDPNRITDPAVLYDHVRPDGGLTLSGMEKLRSEMSGKRTPEGEAEATLKRQFFANAKGQISGSNEGMGLRDPKGDELLLKFTAQALAEYERGRKDGKSASALLNPDSPDYVGKSIANFKRPPDQWFADTIQDAPQKPVAFDPSAVKSLDELVLAHRNGRVDAQTARTIAIQNGWARPRPEPAALPQVPVSQ